MTFPQRVEMQFHGLLDTEVQEQTDWCCPTRLGRTSDAAAPITLPRMASRRAELCKQQSRFRRKRRESAFNVLLSLPTFLRYTEPRPKPAPARRT